MAIISSMTWNEFVSEYKPLEFNDAIVDYKINDEFANMNSLKSKLEPIKKYLLHIRRDLIYPMNHVGLVYFDPAYFGDIKNFTGVYLLGHFVTKKPSTNPTDSIVIDLGNHCGLKISYEYGLL